MDHISREMMELLIKDESLTSFDFFFKKNICIECIKGKYTKVKKKMSWGTTLLECIHTDI